MLTGKTPLLLLAIYLCSGQNHFMTAVRNLNDGKNETRDGDNALKNDFTKHVKECGSDEESAEYEDDFGDDGKKSEGNGGTYPEFYGKSKFKNEQQGDLPNSHNRNYSRGNQTPNGNHNFGERRSDQNNDWRNQQSGNPNLNYGFRPTENQYGYDRSGNPNDDTNNRPMIGGYDRYPNEFYGAIPRRYDDVYRRTKRSDDTNCADQCAFGYLGVLDDNRVPSETAVIKYLQDRVPNDRKRIQYLREARRCFGQLAATDNEDGCGFSEMLAKCLKLETE